MKTLTVFVLLITALTVRAATPSYQSATNIAAAQAKFATNSLNTQLRAALAQTNITLIQAQTLGLVSSNDSRALNLSGALTLTNAANVLGGSGTAITGIPVSALTSTATTNNAALTSGIIQVGNGARGVQDATAAQIFAGVSSQTTLTPVGTNVTVTANSGNTFYVLATTNLYFVQPTGLAVGQKFDVHIVQNATGLWSVGFNTAYWRFPGGFISAATTNAGGYDVISCLVDPYATNVFVVQAQKFQ